MKQSSSIAQSLVRANSVYQRSNRKAKLVLITALATIAGERAFAGAIGVDLGTGNPPLTLGGYSMTAYDPGSIAGAAQLQVGSGWATWGQGYTGNVYFSNGNPSILLKLNAGTGAVTFYEEPNQFAWFSMTATDSSGVSVTTQINGYYGSSGIGFYEQTAGVFLTSIKVTATDPLGFAIGEFGISSGGGFTGEIEDVNGHPVGTGVPDTGSTATLGILGFAVLAIARRSRRS